MDATQAISDSILESEEEENEEENQNETRKPLAKLCVLRNPHIPEKGKHPNMFSSITCETYA